MIEPSVGTPSRRNALVVGLVFGTMLALAVIAATSGRSFFADGAYNLVPHLQTPHAFNLYDPQRTFAYYILQSPILASQKIGVDSAVGFSLALSFGFFVLPIFLYAAAAFVLRRSSPAVAAIALGATYCLFSTNYIVTEVNLLAALVVFCAAIVYSMPDAGRLSLFALAMAAMVLTHVHEAFLFSAPLLAILAASRLDVARNTEQTVALIIVILACVIGALVALRGTLAPRDPANATAFLQSMSMAARGPHVYLGLACLLAMIAARAVRAPVFLATAVLSAVFCSVFIYRVLMMDGYSAYGVYYFNRSLVSVVLAVALFRVLILPVTARVEDRCAPAGNRLAIVLLPLVAVSIADVIGTLRWREYVADFCDLLRSPDLAAMNADTLQAAGHRTGWPWTHPALSVLLRSPGSAAIVKNSHGGWEPPIPGDRGFPKWSHGLCPAVPEANTSTSALPPLHGRHAFSLDGTGHAFLTDGHSAPEGHGTWTEGHETTLQLCAAPGDPQPQRYILAVEPFVTEAFPSQRVRATWNGQPVGNWEVMNSNATGEEILEIPIPRSNLEPCGVLRLELPDARSPASVQMGADPRLLALTLRWIEPR